MIEYKDMKPTLRLKVQRETQMIQVACKYPIYFENGKMWLNTGVPHTFSRIWILEALEPFKDGEPSGTAWYKIMPTATTKKGLYMTSSKIGWVRNIVHHIDRSIPEWLWPALEQDKHKVLETLVAETERRRKTKLR